MGTAVSNDQAFSIVFEQYPLPNENMKEAIAEIFPGMLAGFSIFSHFAFTMLHAHNLLNVSIPLVF